MTIFEQDEIRERLRAITRPVTIGDIVKAVTGDPTDANLGPAFLRLANIVAECDLAADTSDIVKRLNVSRFLRK